jgi:hypothetical protein
MWADDQCPLPADPHSDNSITKTGNAIMAFQVQPDLRFWIDKDFFAPMKEYPQIHNDRLAQLRFFATANFDITDFDSFGHGFCSE